MELEVGKYYLFKGGYYVSIGQVIEMTPESVKIHWITESYTGLYEKRRGYIMLSHLTECTKLLRLLYCEDEDEIGSR